MDKSQKTQFTQKQQQVIDHSIGNLLVSASAGSGKTRVLIAKIVEIILSQKAHLNELLVVTFTNDASTEIKLRLSKELQKSENETLLAELDDLSVCDILTFDKFCIKVVREFGHQIGIDGNFGVADENLSKFLQSKALDSIFSKHNKQLDVDFEDLLEMFFENRNETTIKNSIVKIYNFLQSKANDQMYYKNVLQKTYTQNLNKSIACQYLNNKLLEECQNFKSTLNQILITSNALGSKLTEKFAECLAKISTFDTDFEKNLSIIISGIDLPIIRQTKLLAEEIEIKEIYNKAKASFSEFIKSNFSELNKFDVEKIKNDIENTKRSLQTLFALVDEFDEEYVKQKNRYQVLDFFDIERYANEILQNKQITTALQNKYKYIFIDEYQDTNDLQDGIIKEITSGENLFMVGDVKQSIYRFRQAEPKIFLNKYHNYKKSDSTDCVIELNKNFRSESEILSFANFVFDGIMKECNVGVNYKQDARLEFGETVKKSTEQNQVKFIAINKPEKEQEEEQLAEIYSVKTSELKLGEFKNIQREAIVVANEISKLIGKKYYDVSTDSYKSIQYSDIAILSRKKSTTMLALRDVLSKFNIPVTCAYNSKLFESYDIQMLINILRLIENKQNDYALISTLSLKDNNISFDELAQIRKTYKDSEYFYMSVDDYLKNNNNEISEKIKFCFDKIAKYKVASYSKNIAELILYIVKTENLENYFAINGTIDEFKANLSLLLKAIDSIKNYSLCEFVNYVDTFAGDLSFETKIKGGENAVTITTIHSSKGLEYPVVFLIDTGTKFSNISLTEKVLIENDFGISTKALDKKYRYIYSNPVHQGIKLKIKDEEKKEEMRLLYVALTRPKNYLTVVGTADISKIESIKSDNQIMQKNSYLEWILGLISKNNLNKLTSQNKCQIAYENATFDFELLDGSQISDDISTTEAYDEQICFDFEGAVEILDKKFEKNTLVKKNSVSQILEEEDHYNISDFTDRPTDKTDDDDFLLVGTLSHKIMELLNLTKERKNVEEQVQNLLNSGQISQAELSLVDINAIVTACTNIAQFVDEGDIVLKEQQFSACFGANEIIETSNTDKILVQGIVDLLIIKPDCIYLIDYKTTRIKNEQKLAEKYKTQLDIYSKSAQDFYKKPVAKKMIYSFYLNKAIII